MANVDEAVVFNVARKMEVLAEREAYLKHACGDADDIYHRVLAMLRVYDADRDFLESPAANIAPPVHQHTMRETVGSMITRYKLLEWIGEGGFATVYMAEQCNPIRRKVALKIIKPGMDTRQVIARFEAERQALAMMEHPGIAKVYDAGATETGRPYFVMELIRGIPITEYCDRNRVAAGDRLRLFLDVCHAVQHAHQKGIIHRDIKPSNVLVAMHDGQPVVKVIDFGIAKALHERLTEETLFTSYRQIIGTPQYMSPEQAEFSNLDIDTRSDVYSLGVLLYELLTGTTPFPADVLQGMSYDEICHTIRHSEPPTPSRRLSTLGEAGMTVAENRHVELNALHRLIRGDLDWIVMKALEKDRTRRYDTAESFAHDIQRQLSHEPVQARPPSTAYLLQKFARKHRGPVVAGLATLVLVIAALVASMIAIVRINEQRLIADRQRHRAEANLRLAAELIQDVVAPATNRLMFVPDGHTVQQMKVDLLRGVIAISQRVIDQMHGDPQARLQLARFCIQLAENAFLAGTDERAACRQAITVLEELVAEFPEDAAYRTDLVHAYEVMGGLCWIDLKWKEASKYYSMALAALEDPAAHFPDVPARRQQVASLSGLLAYTLQFSGELSLAEMYYRHVIERNDFDGAIAGQQRAAMLPATNRFAEAKQQLDDALGVIQRLESRSEWDRTLNTFWRCAILRELGKLAICEGQTKAAISFLEQSRDIGVELANLVQYSPIPDNEVAWTYAFLAEAFLQSDKLRDAESALRQSLEVWQSLGGRNRFENMALAHFRLGGLLHCQGLNEAARSRFVRAKELLLKHSSALPDEPDGQDLLVVFLSHCPDPTFRDPRRAVDLAKKVVSESNGPMWRYLALSQYRCGGWQEAEESLQTSMHLRSGGDALDWLLLAMIQWQSDQRSRALDSYSRAQRSLSAGAPISYGSVGVLGFNRLLAEAASVMESVDPL